MHIRCHAHALPSKHIYVPIKINNNLPSKMVLLPIRSLEIFKKYRNINSVATESHELPQRSIKKLTIKKLLLPDASILNVLQPFFQEAPPLKTIFLPVFKE